MAMKQVKLASAYVIIALFSISVIILAAIICHLSNRCSKDKIKEKQIKQVRVVMILTIAAVLLFELTLLLVIAICLQVILIDGHMLHTEEHWIDHVYYDAFKTMEYMVAICDTMAHLCVVFVFIVRYHHSFHNETMRTLFDQRTTSLSVRLIYACAISLSIFGGVILILICIKHSVLEIIILEIIWEILVDIMCLWVLYLFLSKLYSLLQLSMNVHTMNGGSKSGFVKQLIKATEASIERSKSDKSNNETSRKTTTQHGTTSKYTVTIDGTKVEPLAPKARPLKDIEPKSVISDHTNMELTITTKALSDNEHTDNEQTHDEGTHYELELIGVMMKMTILVTCSVIVSVLGVIGNVFIEIEEIRYIEKHDVSIAELWAEILPMLDVLITSVMLYLQFKFAQKTYRVIFGRLDIWCLTKCLQCIEYKWKKKENSDVVYMVETQSSKALEAGDSNAVTNTFTSTAIATI